MVYKTWDKTWQSSNKQQLSHVTVNVKCKLLGKCLKDYRMKVKLKDVIRNLQNSPKSHMNQWTNDQSSRNIWTSSHHQFTTISRCGAVMMTQTALPVTSYFVGCIQDMTVNSEPVSFDRLPGVFGAVNVKECPGWGRACLAAPSFKKKKRKSSGPRPLPTMCNLLPRQRMCLCVRMYTEVRVSMHVYERLRVKRCRYTQQRTGPYSNIRCPSWTFLHLCCDHIKCHGTGSLMQRRAH